MNPSDIRELFASIKACHQGFDDGRAAQAVWIKSMEIGRVDSLDDAQEAVATYFVERPATCNDWPWIKPADVVAGVRAIRSKRLAGVDTDVPGVDPDDVAGYLAALRAGRAAAGARLDRHSVNARPGLAVRPAITVAAEPSHIARDGDVARLRAATKTLFRSPPRVDPAGEGQERPTSAVPARRLMSTDEIALTERRREAQLKALEAMVGEAS